MCWNLHRIQHICSRYEALEEYNKKQTRPDRRIEDYFEHVAGKEQNMAVEIIIQIGDREFRRQFDDMKA